MEIEQQEPVVTMKTLSQKISFLDRHYYLPNRKMITLADVDRIQVGKNLFFMLAKDCKKPARTRSKRYTNHQLHLITNYLLCVDSSYVLPFGRVMNSSFYATILLNKFPNVYKIAYADTKGEQFTSGTGDFPNISRGRLYLMGVEEREKLDLIQTEYEEILKVFQQTSTQVRFLNSMSKNDREMDDMCQLFRRVYLSFLNTFSSLSDRRTAQLDKMTNRNRGAYRAYMRFLSRVPIERQDEFYKQLPDRLYLNAENQPVDRIEEQMESFETYIPAALQMHGDVLSNVEIFEKFEQIQRDQEAGEVLDQINKKTNFYSIFQNDRQMRNDSYLLHCKYDLWFIYNDRVDIRVQPPNQLEATEYNSFVPGADVLFEKAKGGWSDEKTEFARLMMSNLQDLADNNKWMELHISLSILLKLSYTNTSIDKICAETYTSSDLLKIFMKHILVSQIPAKYSERLFIFASLVSRVLLSDIWDSNLIIRVVFFKSLRFGGNAPLFSAQREKQLVKKIMLLLCSKEAKTFHAQFEGVYIHMTPGLFLWFHQNLGELAATFGKQSFPQECLKFYKNISSKNNRIRNWRPKVGDIALKSSSLYILDSFRTVFRNMNKLGMALVTFNSLVRVADDILNKFRYQVFLQSIDHGDQSEINRVVFAWMFIRMILNDEYWHGHLSQFVVLYGENPTVEYIIQVIIPGLLSEALKQPNLNTTPVTQEQVDKCCEREDYCYLLFKLAATKTPFDAKGNDVFITICNQLLLMFPQNIIKATTGNYVKVCMQDYQYFWV